MAEKESGYWFTTETGSHIHVEDGESPEEAVNRYFGKSKEYRQNSSYKDLTNKEKNATKNSPEKMEKMSYGGLQEENVKLSNLLPEIKVNQDWVYQPDDQTDLTDLKQNPIPYVGVGKDFEIGTAVEDAIQKEYKSNVDIDISKLETFQPFVLGSGIDDYKPWDNTKRPYVVEYKNHFYLLDGNHRTAKAKLLGKKKIKVNLSVRIDKSEREH